MASIAHGAASGSRRIVRFGLFEFDVASGELRKQGIRIRLQPKPLQILRALLENPGAIVTREDLQTKLWPADTFVDFQSGLNTAVNRLRMALGDSAENPRYIETLSRSGYRFVAAVTSNPAEATGAVPIVPESREESSAPAPPERSRLVWWSALVVLCAVLVAVSAGLLRSPGTAAPIRFRQITFRHGQVSGGRFAPGGQSILYAAQWERDQRQLYVASPGNPVSRALGFENVSLAAISTTGELALTRSGGTMNIQGGVLFRVAMNGGPMQRVDENIFGADWSPDGSRMGLIRAVAGAQQLEFPAGKVLYRTSGWLSGVRISPGDDALAFIDHPVRHDDAGTLQLADVAGHVRALSAGWANISGLAWRNRDEVWFTATRGSSPRSVWAVDLRGRVRAIGQAPGILTIRDIASDGRVLLTLETRRLEMAGASGGDTVERNFSLTDWSRVQQLSADGSVLLFDESGEGAGSHTVAYLRRIPSGETIRLGNGAAEGLTPDGKSALLLSEDRKVLRLAPLSGGPARAVPATGMEYQWARIFPDGVKILALASYPGQPLGLYVQAMNGGKPTSLTGPLMVRNTAVSPDGRQVAVLTPEGRLAVYTMEGGGPKILPSEEPLAPIRWSRDGRWLFVQHLRSNVQSSSDVSRLLLDTGEMRPWKRLAPSDPIGVNSITGVTIADDEQTYAYSYRRVLSELYVAEGWK